MYKVFLNTDSIIEIYNEGPKTPEEQADTVAQLKKLSELLRNEHKPVLIFDDLSKMTGITEQFRKIESTFEQLIDFDKFAFYCNDLEMKILLNFIIKGGAEQKTRVFKDKNEALLWLKS